MDRRLPVKRCGLSELSPREFELLVAALFHKLGYNVEVTPQTRDGGRDVVLTASQRCGERTRATASTSHAGRGHGGTSSIADRACSPSSARFTASDRSAGLRHSV
ncbi:restriction endonuclease [Arthrobacter sp. 2MCAF14]|uniref:restriction endonuclease n=1 Tax=Arthrobacter sp. 2MCAF14 TaxID=3232982 RepID=UPI003F9274E9